MLVATCSATRITANCRVAEPMEFSWQFVKILQIQVKSLETALSTRKCFVKIVLGNGWKAN